MNAFFRRAVEVAVPFRCVACGTVIASEEMGLCGACLLEIEQVRGGCGRCAGPMISGRCVICGDREFFLDRHVSIAEYRGVMKKVIHALKSGGMKRLVPRLMRVLEDRGADFPSAETVTAVPLSPRNLWKRGYNQSELIAREISKKYATPYRSLLIASRASTGQKNLGSTERHFNVLGRYKCADTASVRGRAILLVDDVFTTGATVNECARVLKGAGAVSVYSITLARAAEGISTADHGSG